MLPRGKPVSRTPHKPFDEHYGGTNMMNRLTGHSRWLLLALIATAALMGCGGGGPGAPTPGGNSPPPPRQTPPTTAELGAASRLGARASFGLDFAAIQSIARDGHETWLARQFSLPAGLHTPIVRDLVERRDAGEFAAYEQDIEFLVLFRRLAWWHQTVTAEDVLRQRVAFALSEIFVVSDTVDALIVDPFALSDYYDTLLTHAFGNFKDLLREVTLHPAMGIYLSHVNNRKADPAKNLYPDENYAREVMQLFSIGLFELNLDGSTRTDASGVPLPTYGNAEIREFAKIFTGLSFGGPGAFFGNEQPNFHAPMAMFDDAHETGGKRLLRGVVVPPGQTGAQDIEAAIDNLFQHPNVGPFIGRLLIQRLVTSNPSPEYITRVARAFNGEASGTRGDMRAVLQAVLLDPEAEMPPSPDFAGKLREPVVRYAALLRQLGANSDDDFIASTGYFLQELAKQHPLSAPSVFNFFLPAHTPTGDIAAAGLVAPEFQITTSNSIVGMTNLLDFAVVSDLVTDAPAPFSTVHLNFDDFVTVAGDTDDLLDRLDIVFTAGQLSAGTRSSVANAIADLAEPEIRTRIALYLVLSSPDYAVRQ